MILEYVKWLSTSELASRGNDEGLKTNSRFKVLHGKFLTKTVDYLSKTSLNEFIEILANANFATTT